MKLRGPHLVSLAILGGIGGWMFTGNLILGGQANPNATTIAERQAEATSDVFRVRVHQLQPSERITHLNMRGRTQAEASISVRAETGGTIQSRPVKKGQRVEVGDLLCELDQGIRKQNLAQAQTQLAQLQADYDSAEKLAKRGFSTKSNLRALKSSLDGAKAAIAAAKQEMSRTQIRATTAGIVQTPLAQIGDNLTAGGVCVTLMDNDPMLFIGQISERDVAQISQGMQAEVKLITQQKVRGDIRYISPIADPQTRTFSVEITLANPDQSIRDGLTATAQIQLAPSQAYKIEPSWLVLNDDGQIGLRSVAADNKVQFHPVKILSQEQETMWVSGLKPDLNIITLGQNYISQGEIVEAVSPEQLKLLEDAASSSKKEEAKS